MAVNQDASMEITCNRCQHKFVTEPIGAPNVVNEKRLSMVFWIHHQLVRCPKCLMAFMPFLAGVQVSTKWGVVPFTEDAEERKKVIIPPS